MSRKKDHLIEKRKQALQKLQSNRGKKRSKIESNSKTKTDGTNLLAQDFIKQNHEQTQKLENSDLDSQNTDIQEIKPVNLPKIAQASAKVQDKQERTTQAVRRLQENRQKIKEIRKLKQQEQTSSSGENKTIFEQNNQQSRHQLKQDLLTADFWQQASQWLSSINTDIHLSSTPTEEIELLYKQAKHRYQALKLMLEDTEKELDAFEAYFRNLDSLTNSQNKHL